MVKSVEAVNPKTIKVTFDKEVKEEDRATVKVTLDKKEVPTDVKWGKDNVEITRTSGANYRNGKYTVAVGKENFQVEIKAKEATTIEITNKQLTANKDTEIKVEVKDQYGEEFNAKDIKIAVKNVTKNKNIEQKGEKFDLSEAEKGDKILVTAVYVDADLSVTKEFEIRSESEIREIKLSELVPAKGDKEVESLISGEFEALYAEVEAFDQYGNKVKVEEDELETVYEPKGLTVKLVDGEGANKDKQFIKVTGLGNKEEDTLVKLKLMVVLAEGPVYSEEVSTTVLAKRQVASMEVVEEPKGSVSVGGTTTMKFKALDQYGEEMKDVKETEAELKVVVKDQNGEVVSKEETKEAKETITVSEAGFNKDITITVNEGTEPEDYTIVVDLKAGEKSIDNYEFDLTVVDAVKSFKAEVEEKEKHIAGEDIEITVKAYKAKETEEKAEEEEAKELYDKYDGSHKVTIKIGEDSFIRELNFENGVAKAKVAPETAGTKLKVSIVDLGKVEVEPETIDVVAAEAKEYKLSQKEKEVKVSLVDEFGNVKKDYNEKGVKVKVKLDGAKSDDVTTEGDALLNFTNGVATIMLTEAEKASEITVEYGNYKGSLVLEEVAGEDQGTDGDNDAEK